jgi:predicted amidohydrolase
MIDVRQVSFSGDRRRLSIGLANLHAAVGDIDANRNKILYALNRFKEAKVNMAVFPEYCLSGCIWNERETCLSYTERAILENQTEWLQENLEPMLDDTLRYVVLNGLVRNTDPGKPFMNGTLVIRKETDYTDRRNIYIKTFLSGIENEYCAPGNGKHLILDTSWGRFGLITCYELCFTPLAHAYAFTESVDGIIITAAWRRNTRRTYPGLGIKTEGYYAYQWRIMCPATAAMNQIWLVACNAVGRHPLSDAIFCGESGLWAPSGINLGRCSGHKEELLIIHNIDIQGERERENRDFDYIADYRKLIERS